MQDKFKDLAQYIRENAVRNTFSVIPAVPTTLAYGFIYNAQLENFLKGLHIDISFLPDWVRVGLLSVFLGANNFSLNFTENKKHYNTLIKLIHDKNLFSTFYHRMYNYPLENSIEVIGGLAEWGIVVFSLSNLLNGTSRNFHTSMFIIGTLAGFCSGFQYATVDGESLRDFLANPLPKLTSSAKDSYLKRILAVSSYFIASLGACNMGVLSFISAQQILRNFFGHSELGKAYCDLLSIMIAMTYAGLDFTLYGIEFIKSFYHRLNEGRWDFPALDSKTRIGLLILAIIGSALMGIVGYDALQVFFYPKRNPSWWAIGLFIIPACVTALQIFNTEGQRLIKLKRSPDGNDLYNEDDIVTERFFYTFPHLCHNIKISLLSLLPSSMAYVALTYLTEIDPFIATVGSVSLYSALRSTGVLENRFCSLRPTTYNNNINLSSILIFTALTWLLALLVEFLGKLFYESSLYNIPSHQASTNAGYLSLLFSSVIGVVADPAHSTLNNVCESTYKMIKKTPSFFKDSCCFAFFSGRRSAESLPLLVDPNTDDDDNTNNKIVGYLTNSSAPH